MPVSFNKTTEWCTYLDPFNNFEPATTVLEKRYDPLTGDVSLLVPFKRFSLSAVNWSGVVSASLAQKCPFCPAHKEESTPRFTGDFYPAGHIVHGGATVVPNLSPYEKYSSVVIMSAEHYLPWDGLSREIIRDSFHAGLLYLKNCILKDPSGARYCSINWNYMPYSGGTLIHPHLQVLAGPEPTNYHRRCLAGEKKYFDLNYSAFWEDLAGAERESGERYVGETGTLQWISSFAPKGLADTTVVFSGCRSLEDINQGHIDSLADGLVRIFPFFAGKNIPSFNFSLFADGKEKTETVVTGRLAGRFPLIPPAGSDMSYLQVLHDTPWTVLTPEDLASELKPLF